MEMAYDNLHNIVSKKQHVEQKGIQFDGVLKAGYDLTYTYNSIREMEMKQTPPKKSFNNRQTIWGFRGWGAVQSGSGHMYPQSLIHDYMSSNFLLESKTKSDSQFFGNFK